MGLPSVADNKAQVLYGPKNVQLVIRPLAPPGIDEVQIEMKATTLCGTDIHYYTHYRNGDIRIREPISQGHEAAGVITSLGVNVAAKHDLRVGDRVALEVGVPCDECEDCLNGEYNICRAMRFRSSGANFPHYQGTLQERLNHPAKWVHKLPESLSFSDGALLEPLAVAVHAVNKTTVNTGASCVIIGAGAVGLLCATAAKASGYQHVVLADIAQNRLDFALEHGFADQTHRLEIHKPESIDEGLSFAQEDAMSLTTLNSNKPFHVVFECSGVESCVRTAIYAARQGGKVVLVGMGSPIQTLPISVAANREVDLVGVWRYANCYPRSIQIMDRAGREDGIPDVRKIITHRFLGLESVPAAFAVAATTKDDDGRLVIKTVIEM